jgi:predicted CoA-binding protein
VADPVIPVVPDDETLRRILGEAHTIAVVGLSSKPGRASLDVAHSLQERGYRIIPVNPRETEVLGETAYPSLREIPEEIDVDIVDVFRRAEDTPEVARDAVAIGAKALWLQLDIVSEEARAIASSGGLDVIMGICIKQTAQRLDREHDRKERNDG